MPLNFIFPQGILEVPIGPGWTGRAWWPINVQALQEAAMRGEPRDLSKETAPGIKELRKRIFDAIASLKVPWNQIILGGFSQGCMLATDICLNAPESPRALVCLSGALVNKEEWKPRQDGSGFGSQRLGPTGNFFDQRRTKRKALQLSWHPRNSSRSDSPAERVFENDLSVRVSDEDFTKYSYILFQSDLEIAEMKKRPCGRLLEKRISPLRERGGFMSHRHRTDRLFSKKTKERLEFYFLLIQIFSLILLVLSQLSS